MQSKTNPSSIPTFCWDQQVVSRVDSVEINEPESHNRFQDKYLGHLMFFFGSGNTIGQ